MTSLGITQQGGAGGLFLPGDFGSTCMESLILAGAWTKISLPSLAGRIMVTGYA